MNERGSRPECVVFFSFDIIGGEGLIDALRAHALHFMQKLACSHMLSRCSCGERKYIRTATTCTTGCGGAQVSRHLHQGPRTAKPLQTCCTMHAHRTANVKFGNLVHIQAKLHRELYRGSIEIWEIMATNICKSIFYAELKKRGRPKAP